MDYQGQQAKNFFSKSHSGDYQGHEAENFQRPTADRRGQADCLYTHLRAHIKGDSSLLSQVKAPHTGRRGKYFAFLPSKSVVLVVRRWTTRGSRRKIFKGPQRTSGGKLTAHTHLRVHIKGDSSLLSQVKAPHTGRRGKYFAFLPSKPVVLVVRRWTTRGSRRKTFKVPQPGLPGARS